MKFHSEIYKSAIQTQGTFEDVFVEDVEIIHKRIDKYLSIKFEMYYINKNRIKILLADTIMGFNGNDDDIDSSNQPTLMSYPNKFFNKDLEVSSDNKQFLIVPFFTYLQENNGKLPKDYEIIDYGWPTYQTVKQYFNNGTFENPEITITEPLAIKFILQKLVINGESLGNQFNLI